ncbi:hypothetical protein [Pseudomonas sp. Q11]|uniref:hypothetical protein n=1 Tax=Pseudomonas sp. Q11 TaxID=2968470 RepID=UPI00210D9FFB|nr:hypothetical protein [Pseudomonas sp. Q11]MCQ6255338.1 hypothetical protein [Pseudomonas sp. Q11]
MGRVLAIIGVVLTVLYAVFAWWLVGDRIQTLRSMGLNEVGDFLAGAFGPLAILWLVLGFFQQGVELRQGTDALRLQAQELNNSVVQQCEMVAAQKASLLNYERTLEPLLHLDVSDSGWSEGGFYVSLNVNNTGEYCESVIIKLFATDNGERSADPLITGASCSVRFDGLHEWEDFEVVVEYKTRSGAFNSQKFSAASYDEEGNGYDYYVRKLPFLN